MPMSVDARLRVRQLNGLRREFRSTFEDFTPKMAKLAALRVKQNIEGQRYRHAPLNRAYKKWKLKHGLDGRILIATHAYVESIQAMPLHQDSWYVGPRPGARHGKRAMSTIGLWLEYGTRRMPARPHYRVEAARIRAEMAADGKKRVKKLGQAFGKAKLVEKRI